MGSTEEKAQSVFGSGRRSIRQAHRIRIQADGSADHGVAAKRLLKPALDG